MQFVTINGLNQKCFDAIVTWGYESKVLMDTEAIGEDRYQVCVYCKSLERIELHKGNITLVNDEYVPILFTPDDYHDIVID